MKKVSAYIPAADPERAAAYAAKLSRMIQYETVSYPDTDQREKFLGFHRILEELFPLLHKTLEKTELDGNLLYYWKGKNHDKPILLMSHQDVVPAEGKWTHEPFSGDIDGGVVWGRGAADIKCGILSFMQAVEELLQDGYTPEQDVYLSSSCTEEVGGNGAPKIVEELKRRGVRIWLLCDEGGAIITDPMAGVKGNFAMVGVFEKGIGNVKFTARSNGGHSSAPGKDGPVDRLAAFVQDVKKHDPFKAKVSEYVKVMFRNLSPYVGGAVGFLMKHAGFFAPVICSIVPKISATAGAMLKTTVCFTMMRGSEAANVIPQEAWVVANLRFIPHQGMEESLAILKKKAEKYGLEMEFLNGNDYSKPVDIHGEAFGRVLSSIETTFPGLPASPYVVTGGTDARFYEDVCDSSVRFTPVIFGPDQMKGMHGIDESMSADCLPGAVDFFKNLIRG